MPQVLEGMVPDSVGFRKLTVWTSRSCKLLRGSGSEGSGRDASGWRFRTCLPKLYEIIDPDGPNPPAPLEVHTDSDWQGSFQVTKGKSTSCAIYESWVVPAGVPSALADIGGRVEANY